MRLHTVTFTGADDATSIKDLIAVSDEAPFVEWGILLSRKGCGYKRYPSTDWLHRLQREAPSRVRLAGHLCGEAVRDVVEGRFPHDVVIGHYRRLQLNGLFRKNLEPEARAVVRCVPSNMECIVQARESDRAAADELVTGIWRRGRKASVLFDSSGGRGRLPSSWPAPVGGVSTGYAGGLSPNNVAAALEELRQHAADASLWIDMESGVRDSKDEFSIEMVRQVVDLVFPFVD